MQNKNLRVTASRIGASPKKLIRSDLYTSNGYWLVTNSIQHKTVKDLEATMWNDTNEIKNEMMQKVIDKAVEGSLVELTDKGNAKIGSEYIRALLENDAQAAIVNYFYLAMFYDSGLSLSFKQEGGNNLAPVIVYAGYDFVGLIMPMIE